MVTATAPSAPVLQPRPLRLAAADGVALHADAYGDPDARPILMAHGFGQSRLAWSESAAALAALGFHCLAIDGRGHGESAWNATGQRYEMEQFIDDARGFARHFGQRPIWVGASMGGLVGIVAEADNPGLFEALVLVDVTPRWERAGVDRILEFMRAYPEGFASVAEARDAVLQYLPHRAERAGTDRLGKMLVTMPNGRLRWHWDPRMLDEVGARGEEYLGRLDAAARRLKLPVLLVSGGQSDVVSDATISEFLTLVPHAEHERIAHATHMVVGDDNHTFTRSVSRFIHHLATPAARH